MWFWIMNVSCYNMVDYVTIIYHNMPQSVLSYKYSWKCYNMSFMFFEMKYILFQWWSVGREHNWRKDVLFSRTPYATNTVLWLGVKFYLISFIRNWAETFIVDWLIEWMNRGVEDHPELYVRYRFTYNNRIFSLHMQQSIHSTMSQNILYFILDFFYCRPLKLIYMQNFQ